MSNFRFWMPLDKIEKSVNEAGEKVMKLGGIASTTRKDTDNESLIPEGFDISYLKEKGIVNWNHSKSPEAIIGEPTKCQMTKKGLYVESELYADSDLANKVYTLAETLNKNSKKRRLGYSIEGKVLARDPLDDTKVTKALITNVALTISPKNPDSIVDIIKGEFNDLSDDDLSKGYEIDAPFDMLANGGKVTYIVDVTRDGHRITVDSEYNIKIEKCFESNGEKTVDKSLSTETGAAVIPEHVDKEEKNQIYAEKYLSKAEVFDKIFEYNSVISLEKANEIFEILNNLTMSTTTSKTKITDDLLEKALVTLNISKGLDTTKKKDDEDEEAEEEGTEGKKKKKDVMEKAVTTQPAAAAATTTDAPSTDALEKAIVGALEKGFGELREIIRSVGVISKGTYDIAKGQESEIGGLKTDLTKALETVEKMEKELETAPGRKSTVTAKPVAKTFEKGVVNGELESGNGGKQVVQMSVSRQKTQIVDLLDTMTFEKGIDNELASAMTLFESSSQINGVASRRLAERGIELVA